jgi:hypothetical protein
MWIEMTDDNRHDTQHQIMRAGGAIFGANLHLRKHHATAMKMTTAQQHPEITLKSLNHQFGRWTVSSIMHPLVRDLYKRALVVGKDYPRGLNYVRETWKKALHDPDNCPSCYPLTSTIDDPQRVVDCEKEIRKAVGKGRYMIREMTGVIQLKKYRTLKKRYDNNYSNLEMDTKNTKE